VRARAALQSANAELLSAEGGHELLRITHGNALSGATRVKHKNVFRWNVCLVRQPKSALVCTQQSYEFVQAVLVYCSCWDGRCIIPPQHTFLFLLLPLLLLFLFSSYLAACLQICWLVRLPSMPSMLALLLTSCTRCCWISWPLVGAWSSLWGLTTRTRCAVWIYTYVWGHT
jgi:hypothetical protein